MCFVSAIGRLWVVVSWFLLVGGHELTVRVSLQCYEGQPAGNLVVILYDDDSHRLIEVNEKYFGFFAIDNEKKPQETRQKMDCKKSDVNGEISLTGWADDLKRGTFASFNPIDPQIHVFVDDKTCSCPAFEDIDDDRMLMLTFFFNDLPSQKPSELKYPVIDKSHNPLMLCQWWKRLGKGKHNPQGKGTYNPWSFKNKSQLCNDETLCGYRDKYRDCFLIEDHPITDNKTSWTPFYLKSGPEAYPVTKFRVTKAEYPTGSSNEGSTGNISKSWIAIMSVLGVIGFLGVLYLIYYEVKIITARKNSSSNTAKKKKTLLEEEKRKNMDKSINKMIEESTSKGTSSICTTSTSKDVINNPKSQPQVAIQAEPQSQMQVQIASQTQSQVTTNDIYSLIT